METRYKDVPISAAKSIAEKYNKNQVIVVAWDAVHGTTHVTTYGKTVEECDQAALGGDRVKQALGWPESLQGALPSRVAALRNENAALTAKLAAAERNCERLRLALENAHKMAR